MAFADALVDLGAEPSAPPSAPAAEPAGASPFAEALRDLSSDSAAPPKNVAKAETKGSETATQAGNVAAGATSSILAGIPGLPGDIANLLFRTGYGFATGKEYGPGPFAGTPYFNEKLGQIGVGTASIPPEAKREFAQDVGQGIGAMVGPNLVAKARGVTGILGSAARPVEEALAAGSLPGNAIIGAASGAGGYGGKEILQGTGYEPLGQAAGALIGGGAGIGAVSLPAIARAGYSALPPLRAKAQEEAATEAAVDRYRAAASDPYASLEMARSAPRELVPGSLPTTGELANDPGLLGVQRYRQAQAGSELGNETRELTAANAEARQRLFQEQAPPTASIEDTQRLLRAHLADLDREGAIAVDAERQLVPDVAPTGTAAEVGERLREPVAAAEAAERQRLRGVREAIDPSGTMGMRPDPIKASLAEIDRLFPAEGGAQLSGVERGLYGTVNNWGDLIPIERAFQMRANVNGRIRGLQGSDPQEAMRLGILKKGIDDALTLAANDIAVGESAGVIHQGLPGIADRMARYGGNGDIGPSFAQDVARAYANNPAALRAAGRDEAGRAILEAANAGNEPISGRTVVGSGGEGGTGSVRPGGASGTEGVSPEPITPLTPEARQKFAEWNADYGQMMRTFRGETPGTQHIVGKILQKGGAYEAYRMADAEVAQALAKPGPMGAEIVNRYLAAGGDAAALGDAMSLAFAKDAIRNGEIVPRLADAWVRRYGEALDAAGIRDRFTDATQAQRRVEQAIADHGQSRDEFNNSVAGRLIQDDPDRAIARLFSGADRVQRAKDLVRMVGTDRSAQDGIRRAALDYIESKLGAAAPPGTEAAGFKPEMFRKFVNENRGVLGQLFPGRVTNFDALAADLERSTLVGRAKINKAGSDTAELTAGRGHGDTGTGTLLAALLGEHAGHHAAHLLGKVGEIAGLPLTITAKLLFSRAKNQVNLRSDQLFDQMLLDPDTAIRLNRAKPFWKVDAPEFQKWKGRLIQQAIASARSATAH